MVRDWLLEEESGQGMVEYALILVLISVAAIAVMTTMGGKILNIFTEIDDSLDLPSTTTTT